MSKLDTFYRSLGVGGGKKNPLRRRSTRNPKAPYSLARLQNDLARLPAYHETIAEVHDAIERVLRKHGLSLAGYVDQAVPYDQTRMMILPTSDPVLYLSVQIYRTPNGRYELTTYATRDARRRRNPAGDLEDSLSGYIARNVYWALHDRAEEGEMKPEHRVPLTGSAAFVAKAEDYDPDLGLKLVLWTEQSDVRDSDLVRIGWADSEMLDPMIDALHYAMHNNTLQGFGGEAVRRNPADDEPTEFDVDADVQAGTGEEPPELPPPDLALDRAERVYEDFHGKPSEELIEAEEEIRVRDTLAVLGRLVQIIVESGDEARYSITFGDDTMLCVSDDGRQLYAVGGDQSLDLEALGVSGPAAGKDKVFVGSALQVTYRTRKQFDDFAEVDYVHDFGEDGGTLPLLVYDRLNQTVEFAGGDYEIKREGIVN